MMSTIFNHINLRFVKRDAHFLISFLTVASSPKIANKYLLSFTDNLSADSVPKIMGLRNLERPDGDLDLLPLSFSDEKPDCLWSCNDTLSSLLLELLSETVLSGYRSLLLLCQ